MTPNLQRRASALLVAVALVAAAGLGTPTVSFAQHAPPGSPGFTSSAVFEEIAVWQRPRGGDARVQSISERTGGAIDPNGEPTTSSLDDPDLHLSPEGGHAIDPDG